MQCLVLPTYINDMLNFYTIKYHDSIRFENVLTKLSNAIYGDIMVVTTELVNDLLIASKDILLDNLLTATPLPSDHAKSVYSILTSGELHFYMEAKQCYIAAACSSLRLEASDHDLHDDVFSNTHMALLSILEDLSSMYKTQPNIYDTLYLISQELYKLIPYEKLFNYRVCSAYKSPCIFYWG